MRAGFLPFSLPGVGEEEIDEVIDTLRSDWIERVAPHYPENDLWRKTAKVLRLNFGGYGA